MRFHRFIPRECVRLGMAADAIPDPPDDFPAHRLDGYHKEPILQELVEVLDESGAVTSTSKLYRDLLFAERKATSGVGDGIAIPHVRTLRCRRFVMGFCRSERGLPFAAVDGEPVRFFFPMIAPPYDDRGYRRVYRELARILQEEACRDLLTHAETADDVIWALQSYAA